MEHLRPESNYDSYAIDGTMQANRFYDRPADVLADPSLTLAQRRAILSSWASDACAVPSSPPMRHAPFARSAVPIDEIMGALFELDRTELPSPAHSRLTTRHSGAGTLSSRT